MLKINFKGNDYPLVNAKFSFGERKISSIELNDSLMNPDGSYDSDEARFIDEQIFYFVQEKQLNLSENKLVELILSEI